MGSIGQSSLYHSHDDDAGDDDDDDDDDAGDDAGDDGGDDEDDFNNMGNQSVHEICHQNKTELGCPPRIYGKAHSVQTYMLMTRHH